MAGMTAPLARFLGAICAPLGLIVGRPGAPRNTYDAAVMEIDARSSAGWGYPFAGLWIVGEDGYVNSTAKIKTHGTGSNDVWYHSAENAWKWTNDYNAPFGSLLLYALTAQGAAGSGAVLTPTISASGFTGSVITNPGSGYRTAPLVSFSGGGGSGAAATANIKGGYVTSLTITNPGSGYTSAPTIAFDNTGTVGSGAAATAYVKGVTSVAVTNGGSGFSTVPRLTSSGGGGSGVLLTCAVSAGAIVSVTVVSSGTMYTSAPTVATAGGGTQSTTFTPRFAFFTGYNVGSGFSQAYGSLWIRRETSGQTGNLLQLNDHGGTGLWVVGPAGIPQWVAAAIQQTTVGAAGAASALPATPAKYLQVKDSAGTLMVIPAYAAS